MLFQWAYIPGWHKDARNKDEELSSLSKLALDEEWGYRENNSDDIDEFGVLRSYLTHTFTRLHNEGKVVETDKFATFNTGLVKPYYDPIYALFELNTYKPKPKNRDPQPWRFRSFCAPGQEDDGILLSQTFKELPAVAKYFDDMDDIYFDADAKLDYNKNHVVRDGIRADRYPSVFIEEYAGGFCRERYEAAKKEQARKKAEKDEEINKAENREAKVKLKKERDAIPNDYLEEVAQRLDADVALFRKFVNRLDAAIDLARKRARWNYRTAVPQYYPRYNYVSFLLPLALMSDDKDDAALVVQSKRVGADETLGDKGMLHYQGRTIFPLSYAYRNARLLAKPISDWLDQKKILEQ